MHLSEMVRRKKFIFTCEIDSPKGVNLEEFLNKVDLVKDSVDAINISDNERAVMRAGPLALCHLLKEKKVEPVMHLTTRDRNRVALQADLLAAAIMGIENMVLLTGYDLSMGDHVEAKPVHDLDCVGLAQAVASLNKGTDLSGNPLNGAPSFCFGVMAAPGVGSAESQLADLKEKVARGAQFIETQAIYEPEVLEKFIESVRGLNVPVIVGHMMLKSASMASFLNSNVPGVKVPDRIIRELEGLPREKAVETSLKISVELIKKLKPMCQGIRFIPAGWERYVPRIVEGVA